MSDPLPLTPEQRIKQLDTQRKTEFFEAMIYVSKRDYGISLGCFIN